MIELTADGYYVDTETGEITACAEQLSEFTVDSIESAEWVLQKMQEVESNILALETRKSAIIANMEAQIRQQQARANYLDFRFGPELRAFAERELAGKKARSITTPYGKFGFRRTQGSIKITNPSAALEWAMTHAPGAIQVKESLTLSPLKGRESELPANAFDVVEPCDKFTIETGISKSKNA